MVYGKPGLTDDEIDQIREGMPKSLVDCLNDPYDFDGSGDPFSSAYSDLREFARLIDVAAVEKAKQSTLRDRAMLEYALRNMIDDPRRTVLTLETYLRTLPV